jgi:hypothetical protein
VAIVVLFFQSFLWADGLYVRITKANSAKPEWLSIIVRQASDAPASVVLRMDERKDIIDYSVVLQMESGVHTGMRIPVAVTKAGKGFAVSMALSTQVASSARLVITETWGLGDGGSTYEVDISTYLTEQKK